MKHKIIFCILFSASLILASCIKEHETTTYFYIKNISNHAVEVKVFNADLQLGYSIDTLFLLEPLVEFNYFVIVKGEDSPSKFPFGVSSDSALVIFNDTTIIKHKQKLRYNDSSVKNILSIDSYEVDKKDDDLYKCYYSITEEDYNNAITDN
jgi:hypothetical protein